MSKSHQKRCVVLLNSWSVTSIRIVFFKQIANLKKYTHSPGERPQTGPKIQKEKSNWPSRLGPVSPKFTTPRENTETNMKPTYIFVDLFRGNVGVSSLNGTAVL